MTTIQHYKIVNKIGENRYGIIYRGIHRKKKKYVLIKQAKPHLNFHPFLHGYYTEQQLPYDRFFTSNASYIEDAVPLIVYNEQPLISLREYIKVENIDILTSLHIFLELTIILSIVHEKRLIHNYLQPENIFIHTKTKQVFLTGFEQTIPFIRGGTEVHQEDIDDRFIPYLSPEQTGKINRPIDHRSDLYSLGCIMYELFTGQTPFDAGDANETIYAHIAKPPKPPKQIQPIIPTMISHIILKLLEKEPENRYQSSLGLKQDLESCRRLLYKEMMDDIFPLGKHDHFHVFEIPYTLYGRTEEINTIRETFQRVKKGHSEILFVRGEPGIGKTALIHEVFGEFVKEKAIFIEGKYDLLHRQDPYRPIAQAFSQFIKHLTIEGEESIKTWRKAFTTTLGENLPILTGLIPELQWITGEVKRVREFSSIEEQRRFQITFLTFINTITEKIQPIILFLDDLQWADRASLNLLEYIFTSDKCPYFFVIGAYRDHEVKTGHPLEYFLHRLNEQRQFVNLTLSPLSVGQTKELIQNTLRCEENEGDILANFLYPLTAGNPLFIRQILYSFYDEGFITPRKRGVGWEIHFQKIQEMTIDEHIVPFILKKIDQLPDKTIELLEMASCLGNQFSLQDLVQIMEIDPMDISKHLWKALKNGFIIPMDPDYIKIYNLKHERLPIIRYRFSHDHIQQAVYSKMGERKKEAFHFQIGNWLQSTGITNLDQNGFRLMELVNHFNLSISLLSKREKYHLILWNMEVGKRLQKNGAFEPALKYFQKALHLLPEQKWDKYHSIAYELTIATGECEFLTGNYKHARALFEDAINHANTPLEKLQIYYMEMNLFNYINRFDEALEKGLKGLALYREPVPRKVNKWKLTWELLTIKNSLLWKKAENLLSLPKMESEEKEQVLQTYVLLNTPTFFVDQKLATFFMLRAVRFTLKNGNTEATSLVYNNYALILSAGFKDYKGSYEFGKLAIRHAEKYGNPNYLGRVYFVFGCFVNHWKSSLTENIRYLERSQSLSLESGNLTVAGSSSSFIIVTYFFIGTNLSQLKSKVFEQLDFTKKIDYSLSNEFLSEMLHWIDILTGENEKISWTLPLEEENDNAVIMHYTVRLQVFYIMGEVELGLKTLRELENLVHDRLTLVVIPTYTFYASLFKLKLWRKGVSDKNRNWRREIRSHVKNLKLWANHSPYNYEHQYLAIFGFLKLMKGKEKEGIYLIQRAIQLAGERGFIQDQAVINEWIGEYFFEKGLNNIAELYLREAEKCFQLWGAYGKANQLVKQYSTISFHLHFMPKTDESFNMKTMIQATETLSKERKVDRLLKKYMEFILKNVGADLGFLIVFHRKKGLIKVSGKINEGIHVYHEGKPIESELLPMSVIHYVSRSQSEVYLNNASKSELFSNDPYIVQHGTKSLLCLPIILSGEQFGILYLENNLSTNVQFLQQLTLLKTLSSQAAIFYINAQLYENLETTVEERTKELAEINRQLELKNNELARTEQLQKELFSNISHDLRSPLSAIQGYIYAVFDGYVDDPEKKKLYLKKSLDRLEEMNRLIQDLFELAKLQKGRGIFQFEFVKADDFFHRIFDKFQIDVTKHGLAFHKEIHPQIADKNLMIYIDTKRMEQVFSNFISNAIKHTKEGEISLHASIKDDFLIFSVQDSGEGIRQTDLPFVFDRFFTRSQKGHGIGLSIAKEIVNSHGGEIWVESEYKKGSTFYVSLPINKTNGAE